MKHTKMTLSALLLSAALLLPVSVSAAETVPADDLALLRPSGLTLLTVTSSDSEISGTDEKAGTEALFDGRLSTMCEIAASEDGRTLSIYTATRVPEAVRAFALTLAGLDDAHPVLGVSVFATNDSLLLDWTALDLYNPPVDTEGYYLFEIAEPERYSFYRIDITAEPGDGFRVGELLLFRDADDDAVYYYESDGEVEAGESPKLVLVEPEEKPADKPQYRTSPFIWNQVFNGRRGQPV